MKWRNGLLVALLAPAGCGDRLNQGDRVILVNPGAQSVKVSEGEVATGTRATVVLDDPKEIGEERKVRISVIGPPYDGQTGWVRRKYLRPE